MKSAGLLYGLAAVTILWLAQQGGLGTPAQPDLSERDWAYQLGVILDPNEALPGCRRNHGDVPCDYEIYADLYGPRTHNPEAPPITGLPYTVRNAVYWSNRTPEGGCGNEKLVALEAFMSRHADVGDSLIATMLPTELAYCFSINWETEPPISDFVLFFHRGSLAALIDCYTFSSPNPNCRMEFFVSGGLYAGSMAPVPIRNIDKLLAATPRLIEDLLAQAPRPLPDDFHWEPLPDVVQADESVVRYIHSVLERL